MNKREFLKALVIGQRPGLWIEILHREEDGAPGYIIHYPLPNGTHWREFPILAMDWEAVEILAPKYAGREDAAATLPRYDEGRTFSGEIHDKRLALALARWAKFKDTK